jgi:putative ABC transport system ATP-binding protein
MTLASSQETSIAEENAVVQLVDVQRRFDVGESPVYALDGVTLTLGARQVVAITGPSGAGKSSLLHILGALDAPTSGRVCINGTDITGASERTQSAFRLHNIGFVFQSFNLLPTLTAWENVALPRLFAGESIRGAKGDAAALLERVGLADRVAHRPNQLSGGEIQRVASARALIMKPSILLADEPTGNLDSKSSQDVMELFREIVESETTLLSVVVTHNLALANSFAERVITIRDGSVESDTTQAGRA